MVGLIKVGTHVAVFYIDEGDWFVGIVKELGADHYLVKYDGGREWWPYKFEDDAYGTDKVWVIVQQKRVAMAVPVATVHVGAGVGGPATQATSAEGQTSEASRATSCSVGPPSKKPRQDNDNLCSYEDQNNLGCRCAGIQPVACTNRACNNNVHHACFIAHYPSLAENSVGKRLCASCAYAAV